MNRPLLFAAVAMLPLLVPARAAAERAGVAGPPAVAHPVRPAAERPGSSRLAAAAPAAPGEFPSPPPPTVLRADPPYYVKAGTWQETVRLSREALTEGQGTAAAGSPLPDLGKSDFTITAFVRTTKEGGTIMASAPASGPWEPQGKAFFLREGRPGIDVGWVGFVGSRVAVNDGAWHHVAFAKKGEVIAVYVDGERTGGGRLSMKGDRPGHVLKIGFCSPNFPGKSGFSGLIDEVRLYGRELAPGEIAALARGGAGAGAGGRARSGVQALPGLRESLAGHWTFEEGAADVSGKGNHGRMGPAAVKKGQRGMALSCDGKTCVLLPRSTAEGARNRILDLAARDFPGRRERREMVFEIEDGIWEADWEPGDFKELAGRYAAAVRSLGDLRRRARRAAAAAADAAGLAKVRAVYLASRFGEEALGGLKETIDAMEEEIGYLAGNHGKGDAAWRRYGEAVASLKRRAEAAALRLGRVAAAARIAGLKEEAARLHAAMPLVLPAGPPGPGRFGAFYGRLRYSLSWDRQWSAGPFADVVVRFDDGGHRFVFWRGTSYVPCWVTENGKWYTGASVERRGGSSGTSGCCGPMSDKQARYSHVRVLESSEARAVIHWRNAPAGVNYRLPFVDDLSGWGDWVDEVYTVYPDAAGVRKVTLHTSAPEEWTQWQESIVINRPGTRPEDNIALAAVTLANLGGETRTFSWETRRPERFDGILDPCICVINMKSRTRPFAIFDPAGASVTPCPGRGGMGHFHCWNHWPVAREKPDRAEAETFDRPSHTSLLHIVWRDFSRDDSSRLFTSRTKLLLHGLTAGSAAGLAPLARSWLHPPKLVLREGAERFESEGYDRGQRAYVLRCKEPGRPVPLGIELEAGGDSPAVNPAFVVKGWGRREAALEVKGAAVPRGRDFRAGLKRTCEGYDLVVWIRTLEKEPFRVSMAPVEE